MLAVKLVETNDELIECYRLRAAVYGDEKGWVTPAQIKDGCEIDEFDAHSIQIMAFEPVTGDVIGHVRLILNGSHALPVETLFDQVLDKSRKAVEASRLVVRKDSRGPEKNVTLGLVRQVYTELVEREVDDLYAILEGKLLRAFQMMGLPFEQLAPPRDVWGAMTMPTVCPTAEWLPGLHKKDAEQNRKARLGAFFEQPWNGLIYEGMIPQ